MRKTVSSTAGSALRRLGNAASSGAARSEPLDRVAYQVAAVLFCSGLVHLGVQAALGGPWSGPVSWRKPITFGLSFGLTLATVTWVTGFLPTPRRRRASLLGVFAVACVLEVVVITVQAWRRVPSHFNLSTPVNSAFATVAAIGGAMIIISAVLLAVDAVRGPVVRDGIPAAMPLALRVGFGTFLAALAIGAFMIALGVREARTGSQDAAYTVATQYKAGHGVTMHGILILPLLAWLAGFTDWPARRQIGTVALGAAGYLLVAVVAVADTFAGVDPFDPVAGPVLPVLLLGVGLLALVAAGLLTVTAVLREPSLRTPIRPPVAP